jgi:PAS domain S-box-containing protein
MYVIPVTSYRGKNQENRSGINCIALPDVRKRGAANKRCCEEQAMSEFGRRQGDVSKPGDGAFGRRQADLQFDQSPDLLGVVALDFKLKVINQAWERTLGYVRSEMLGRSLSAFVDSDEHIPVHRLLNPNRPAGPNEVIEFSLRCKDGSYRCFSWTQRSIPAEQVVFIVGKDITERKKIETTQNLQSYIRKGSGGPR